jgi:hypothetical protein
MKPTWTVLYNITTAANRWIGTGWEFFDNEVLARNRVEHLQGRGFAPTLRPYQSSDKSHLGAVHEMNGEG